jgi:MFS superfamily sulfate permease-like transporter
MSGNAPSRWLPSLDWLTRYDRSWLSADVLAGLTAAAVVIPKAMAYATVAKLPVEIGLYTVLIPVAVYALLGTSRAPTDVHGGLGHARAAGGSCYWGGSCASASSPTSSRIRC